MKKASTYYFAALALLNGLVVCGASQLNGVMTTQYARMMEGKRLPALTELVVAWPWWPHLFCFLGLAGCAISLCTRLRSVTLCHAIIVCLLAELLAAFIAMMAYALPFVAIICTIGE
jgi:hypothetical protein